MKIAELQDILREFNRGYRFIQKREEIHGIQAVVEDKEPVIEILTDPGAKHKLQHSGLGVPKTVTLNLLSGKTEVRILILEKPIARAMAAIGRSAAVQGFPGSGTLGWNIQLDGALLCVSNWHVLCPQGNSTPLGSLIELDGNVEAILNTFIPVLQNRDNSWDMAFGLYQNAANWLQLVRNCDEAPTNPMPYPTQLTSPGDVRTGEAFWTVGIREPHFQRGSLRGIGQFRIVDYNELGLYRFGNQLIFTEMCCPGDSGSIIVHERTNTVTGLLFAGDGDDNCAGGTETIANPLYTAPWAYKGLIYVESTKSHLPVFESTSEFRSSVIGAATSSMPLATNADKASDLAILEQHSLRHASDSAGGDKVNPEEQQFQTGFSVLGIARQMRKRSSPDWDFHFRWITEPPAGTLQQLLVSVTYHIDASTDHVFYHWLCLGRRGDGHPIRSIGTISRPDARRWKVSDPETVVVGESQFQKWYKGWSFHGTDLLLGEKGEVGHWVLGATIQDQFGRVISEPPIFPGTVTTSYPLLEEFKSDFFSGRMVRSRLTSLTITGTVPQAG